MKYLKRFFSSIFLIQMFALSVHAQDANLAPVHARLYGNDLFHPSPGSALYEYLNETNAQTVVRTFPKVPSTADGSPLPQGVEKLVVAVSPETFPAFIKYFSPENYLYAISIFNYEMAVAYKGRTSYYSPPFRDTLRFQGEGTIMMPVLMDDEEAARAANFVDVITQFGNNWSGRDSLFYPQNLKTLSGAPFFPKTAFWDSCAAWYANLPIGHKLVDTYYFPSGTDVDPAIPQKLEDYKLADPVADARMHKIWQVPGHQQLGDILDHEALGRGEFHNGGWILYTLLGVKDRERAPIVFLQVNDESKPIDPNFKLQFYPALSRSPYR